MNDFRTFLVIGASSLATHLVFNRYEPTTAVPVLWTLFFVPSILAWILLDDFHNRITGTLCCYLEYLLILAVSICTYRLSPWHPLGQYPGPSICKVSKWWGVWECYAGNHHRSVRELHQKHGSIVRVGPNELSISDVSALPAVLGSTGLPKGHWYGCNQDPKAPRTLQVLKGSEHAHRRKLWNRGMSTESLKAYEGIIENRAHQLVRSLESECGKEILLSTFFNFFTFDCLGDMAFGGAFEMIRDGDWGNVQKTVEDGAFVAMIFAQIPWMLPYARLVPSWRKKQQALRVAGSAIANDRVERGTTSRDLWYHLMDEAGLEKEKPSGGDVASDGVLALVAGADTTRITMTIVFYHLLSRPHYYKRLQAEIDAMFPSWDSPMDGSKLGEMPFLSACINEALRTYPPVPTNGSRRVVEGMGPRIISGGVVPEGTEVFVSAYQLHRDPRYFSPLPETFLPERWLQDPSNPPARLDTLPGPFIHDTTAFIPFSYGPQNCVGRQLAVLEIRFMVCLLVRRFDLQFPTNFNAEHWPTLYYDRFIAAVGHLPVLLTRR